MHALILFAVMSGIMSNFTNTDLPTISQPVKCPPGYALPPPAGRNSITINTRSVLKPIAEQAKISKPIKQVSLRQTAERH